MEQERRRARRRAAVRPRRDARAAGPRRHGRAQGPGRPRRAPRPRLHGRLPGGRSAGRAPSPRVAARRKASLSVAAPARRLRRRHVGRRQVGARPVRRAVPARGPARRRLTWWRRSRPRPPGPGWTRRTPRGPRPRSSRGARPRSIVMCHVPPLRARRVALLHGAHRPLQRRPDRPVAARQGRCLRAPSSTAVRRSPTTTPSAPTTATWMTDEVGTLGVEVLRAVKATLDPAGVLNPGKLIPHPRGPDVRRLQLVVNPAAGGGRAPALLPSVEAALRSAGHDLARDADPARSSTPTSWPPQAVADDRVVVAMGGDGIVGRVAGARGARSAGCSACSPAAAATTSAAPPGCPQDPVEACARPVQRRRAAGRPRRRHAAPRARRSSSASPPSASTATCRSGC